jgi:UDP-N-acetylenolpyruvoylglucosamine reductase
MQSRSPRFFFNEPLSRHTRIGTGGPVSLLAFANTVDDVRETVLLCRDRDWPLMVLGKGSNILAPDEGYPGAMLKLGGQLSRIVIDRVAGTVSAGGGTALMHLGLQLSRQGDPGFTYMGVIPGSVGGAVRMNAGIDREQAIEKDFLRAVALDLRMGEIKTLEAGELAFGYRTSCLAAHSLIILEVVFRLPSEKVSGETTLSELRVLLNKRHAAQPSCFRTFGSTFKNPPPPLRSAGWYLEQVGMQGMRLGGAMVSREHANWIINTGGAKTIDILGLICVGRERVFEKFGLDLQEEVIIVPGTAWVSPV